MQKGYDIIGDIHGHAEALKTLLEKLGYHDQGLNGYQHPFRQVIFLGDFVDRGPAQREVLQIVMSMIKQGSALSVMGNHEFNALAFHTENPAQPKQGLRHRTIKNINQHLAFLQAYAHPKYHEELATVLNFFYSLPLWLDLPGLRVIHACWNPEHIASIRPHLGANNTLTKSVLVKASEKNTTEYLAVETLLKGLEYRLPNGIAFKDKDGTERTKVRTRWWINEDTTFGEITIPHGILDDTTGKIPVSACDLPGYPPSEKPVFLGHYWFSGRPTRLANNIACLDYSIAKGGKLVAYRWSGEQNLRDENFIY